MVAERQNQAVQGLEEEEIPQGRCLAVEVQGEVRGSIQIRKPNLGKN